MTLWKKVIVAAILFALLTASLAACGSSSTSAGGASQQSLGTITLYTADGLEAYYKQVIPMFQQKYHAKVNMVTDGSGAVVNRLQIEKDNPQADVVVTLPPFVQQAEQAGLLTPYKSQADSHIPASRKDSQGEWYTFVDNYITWVYNPQTLQSSPQTFDDLASSKYKDQIAYSSPITAGDGFAVLIELETLWGQQKTFAFLKKLEPNVKFHTKGTGYLDILVNRNEIQVANGDLQQDLSDKVQGGMSLQPTFLRPSANDAPITFEDPYVIGLVKGGHNTKGGQALIDFLLSQQAQQLVWSVFGGPARDDISANGNQNAQTVQQDLNGVRILTVDWNSIIQNRSAWQQVWQTEILNAYGKPGSVQP